MCVKDFVKEINSIFGSNYIKKKTGSWSIETEIKKDEEAVQQASWLNTLAHTNHKHKTQYRWYVQVYMTNYVIS